MPRKKPASAAQSKIFESGALILLPLMIPGNGCRREGDAIFELRLKPQINDRFAPSYFCGFNCGRACGLLYIFASPTNRFGQSRSATASWHAYIQCPDTTASISADTQPVENEKAAIAYLEAAQAILRRALTAQASASNDELPITGRIPLPKKRPIPRP